jgi:hypothetical protein
MMELLLVLLFLFPDPELTEVEETLGDMPNEKLTAMKKR